MPKKWVQSYLFEGEIDVGVDGGNVTLDAADADGDVEEHHARFHSNLQLELWF